MQDPLNRCIFCKSQQNLTSDHIPPKSLFPSPRPNNLITVPACISCNQGFKNDEEYFRIAISSLCGDSTRFQDLLLNNVFKQLNHQPKLATTIQRDLIPVAINEKTLYGISNRNPRIDRIMRKIIKGLYFHEQKKPLSTGQFISWNFVDAEYISKMGDEAKRILQGSTLTNIADGIFQYAVRFSKTGDSFWILSFYSTVEFFAVTTSNPPLPSLLNSYFWRAWSSMTTIFRKVCYKIFD